MGTRSSVLWAAATALPLIPALPEAWGLPGQPPPVSLVDWQPIGVSEHDYAVGPASTALPVLYYAAYDGHPV